MQQSLLIKMSQVQTQCQKILQLDLLKLEISYGLMSLVSNDTENNLTSQLKGLRKQIMQEYGFIIPSIRIQDNIQLSSNTYLIKIKEMEAARGVVYPDMLMIVNTKDGDGIPGTATKEPSFGLPSKWVDPSYKEEALFNNLYYCRSFYCDYHTSN